MSTVTEPSAVERLDGNRVRVQCRKCHTPVTLDFGAMDRQAAEEVIAKLNRTPMECPGYHVELGGWNHHWRLLEALQAVFGPKS